MGSGAAPGGKPSALLPDRPLPILAAAACGFPQPLLCPLLVSLPCQRPLSTCLSSWCWRLSLGRWAAVQFSSARLCESLPGLLGAPGSATGTPHGAGVSPLCTGSVCLGPRHVRPPAASFGLQAAAPTPPASSIPPSSHWDRLPDPSPDLLPQKQGLCSGVVCAPAPASSLLTWGFLLLLRVTGRLSLLF